MNPQRLSLAEFERFLELPENSYRRFELVNGDVVELQQSGVRGMLLALVAHHLAEFVNAHELGRIGVETRCILPPATLRCVGVGFFAGVSRGRTYKSALATPVPNLAVEVVSPRTLADDLHERVLDFLDAGTRLVWVIHPRSQTVTVHQGSAARLLRSAEILDGGDVLPGFALQLRDLFAAHIVEPEG